MDRIPLMLGSSTVRTLVAVSILSLAAGCKGKPKARPAPASPDKVETTANSKPAAPHDVDLPHGPGTPPVKTSKPVDHVILQKLADMDFPDFVKDVRGVSDQSLWVLQQIASHPVLRASIHVLPCTNPKAHCWPMDLATWKSHDKDLKEYLPPALQQAPDTVFEIGQTDLHGQPLMYTYQLGQTIDKSSAFSHAYVLYFNDGVNEIRVLSEYKDDMMKTKEDMAKALPRSDLENTSKAFLDVYSHAWAQ
jgi:hypothetical protein